MTSSGDTEETLNILAMDGKVKVVGHDKDGPIYRMTTAGNAKAEELMRQWGVDPDDPNALRKLKEAGFFG